MYPKKISSGERLLFWLLYFFVFTSVFMFGTAKIQAWLNVFLSIMLGKLVLPKIELLYSVFKQNLVNSKLKRFSFRGEKYNVPHIIANSSAELISALCNANKKSLRFCIKGSGHSGGQQFKSAGLIIENYLSADNKSHAVAWKGDNIIVQGRATIKDLTDFAKSKGRKIRCIQDHGDFTVGGTLSVGGIGWDSVKYGFQANYIKGVKMITPEGKLLECNESLNSDIFKFALGGMGQLGVIEEAEYETIPLKPFWKKLVLKLPSLRVMFQMMKTIQEQDKTLDLDFFHTVHALQTKKSIFSFCGKFFHSMEEAQLWQPPFQLPLEYLVHVLVGEGKVDYSHDSMYAPFNAWEDYMFPSIQNAANFAEKCFGTTFFNESSPSTALSDISFAKETVLSYYLIKCPKYDHPLLPGFSERFIASVGVYFCLDSHIQLAEALKKTNNMGDSAVDHGGKPYNYGAYELPNKRARILYSTFFDEFNDLKRKMDPLQLCNKNEAHALTDILK